MKVYDFQGFPNPARVRIALAEKGLTNKVQFITVDVPGGEHKTPAFMAKNPAAAVPVLELDDGTTIAECTAITEYLDHLSGEPVLTGRTPKERAVIHMMHRRSEAGLLDAAYGEKRPYRYDRGLRTVAPGKSSEGVHGALHGDNRA